MTIFSVHHTTTYRYKTAVRPGLHHMMFRPRDSFDQRLLALLWQNLAIDWRNWIPESDFQ
jgi:Bacterial transglutaminase-like N-terminal region